MDTISVAAAAHGSPLFAHVHPRLRPPVRALTEVEAGMVDFAFDRLAEGQGKEVTPRQVWSNVAACTAAGRFGPALSRAPACRVGASHAGSLARVARAGLTLPAALAASATGLANAR
jgi:hypothetical protein